jgi:hypothetical protein
MRKIITSLLFFFSVGSATYCQNITGSWEGIMNDEVLRIQITQDGNDLCGYTSDVLISNPDSYCIAYFKGKYSNKTWTFSGIKFIQNSGDHVLMKITLRQSGSNPNMLVGNATTAGSLIDLSLSDQFTVRKVSDTPKKPFGSLSVCYERNPPPKRDEPRRNNPPNDPTKKPTEQPITRRDPPKKEDPPKTDPPKENSNTKPSKEDHTPDIPVTAKTEEMKKRENTVFKELKINTKTLKMTLYDNGEFDNDTVSVFYNGKLILDKALLTDQGTPINLELDLKAKNHEITLFAENVGSIPPNTALIIIQAGKDRFELNARSEMDKNAVLRFVYDPDQN